MIKPTCLWSILSLSLLLKASCNKSVHYMHCSLSSTLRTGTSLSALLGIPPLHVLQQRRHPVAFVSACRFSCDTTTNRKSIISVAASGNNKTNKASPQKTMDFLKRIGKVGNTVDTECLIGVDEGNTGGCTSSTTSTSKQASDSISMHKNFRSCIETSIIDDMTNEFPFTNTGSRWDIFTDQVMGGVSTGDISRESHYHGRDANILRGTVRLDNNGGFIQMATNFAPTIASDGSTSQNNSFRTATPIDASKFTGIEIDVHCDVSDTFNVHLKTSDCTRPQISYRAPFDTPTSDTEATQWTNVKIPFSQFHGHNIDMPLDISKLTRIGIVAIGREMQSVQLAVASIRFF